MRKPKKNPPAKKMTVTTTHTPKKNTGSWGSRTISKKRTTQSAATPKRVTVKKSTPASSTPKRTRTVARKTRTIPGGKMMTPKGYSTSYSAKIPTVKKTTVKKSAPSYSGPGNPKGDSSTRTVKYKPTKTKSKATKNKSRKVKCRVSKGGRMSCK